jgi:O-antigen biosynthesis protein
VQVSFVIPLYNCLALTRACVASLQANLPAGLAHEIILVDDGSTDGTREWLKTLSSSSGRAALAPPFRVVLDERNLGYAAANNRGAAIAGGELLALLNNDLVLTPRWLEPMLVAHRSLGDRAGLIGNVQLNADSGQVDHVGIVIDAKGKPEHDRTPPSRLARLLTPVRRVPAVTAACVVLDRALWRQFDGFDEGFINGGEDVDLCFRVRAAGRVNAVALRSVVRHHVSSSAGRKLHDEENSRRLAQRWRREFALAAARGWCRHRFESILLEPRDHEPSVARRVWFHALGLTRTPPPEAIVALDASLDREFDRWREILPSSPGADS